MSTVVPVPRTVPPFSVNEFVLIPTPEGAVSSSSTVVGANHGHRVRGAVAQSATFSAVPNSSVSWGVPVMSTAEVKVSVASTVSPIA